MEFIIFTSIGGISSLLCRWVTLSAQGAKSVYCVGWRKVHIKWDAPFAPTVPHLLGPVVIGFFFGLACW